jgi:hypothetical protein
MFQSQLTVECRGMTECNPRDYKLARREVMERGVSTQISRIGWE